MIIFFNQEGITTNQNELLIYQHKKICFIYKLHYKIIQTYISEDPLFIHLIQIKKGLMQRKPYFVIKKIHTIKINKKSTSHTKVTRLFIWH